MPKSRRFHNNFVTGQISSSLAERYDFEKREGALAKARNVRIRPQGGLVRRDGTRLAALAKNSNERVRLVPFVFSRTQAYVLEFGDLYIRFYRDGGQLVDGVGIPIEVTTPWDIDAVQELDFSQDADTVIITHNTRIPRILQRWSDTNWTLNFINFRPPPVREDGVSNPAITLTFALISGSRYTVTASASLFGQSDVGRTIFELGEDAQGVAVVDTFTSSTVVEVTELETFTKNPLTTDPNGDAEWLLASSPIANLALTKTETGKEAEGYRGELVTPIAYLRDLPGATNEITNNDFSSSLTGWTDYSGPLIYTGTHTGGGADNFIVDSGSVNFRDEGVEENHLMLDGTLGTPGDNAIIADIRSTGTLGWDKLIPDNTDFAIASGNTYEVRETSHVEVPSAGAALHSGPNGTAWIEQSFTADQSSVYEYEITVRDFSTQFQVGSAAKGSDVVDTVTLNPGITTVVFTTPNLNSSSTFTAYVQLFNNQPNTVPIIENVVVRKIVAASFRGGIGATKWLRVNGGYVGFLNTISGSEHSFEGVIESTLDDGEDALPGSWTINDERFDTNLFPSNVAFYQGRLWLSSQLTVWGSVLDNINSFSFGVGDSDALEFSPAATEINPVHWMVGERQFLIGTRGEEYVASGTETNFLKPTDINVISPTAVGSEPVKPARVEQTVLFVKTGGRRIIEYNFAPGQAAQHRDLSILVDDLIAVGDRITQIAYQDEPYQILWCVTNNGLLLALTYVKEHNIWAWTVHDSTDGALFESVTVIPHPDGDRDQVWLSIKRPTEPKSQVSYMDDAMGLIPGLTSTTTDGTLRYTGASTTSITGLTHLNGASVYAVDATGIQGPYTVVGGSITLDRAVTLADIGVGATVEVETVRPAIDGQGPTGLIIGDTNMFARFRNTGDGITVRSKLLKLRKPTDPMDNHITPVNREVEIPTGAFDREITINMQQAIPAQFELQSLAGTIVYESP